MRASSFLLFIVVAVALVAAFLGGRYVGRQDADRAHRMASALVYSSQSAEKLMMANAALEFMGDGQIPEATLLLERYARLQVASVNDCLKDPVCTPVIAPNTSSFLEWQRVVTVRAASAP
jgi:hypothetical protein